MRVDPIDCILFACEFSKIMDRSVRPHDLHTPGIAGLHRRTVVTIRGVASSGAICVKRQQAQAGKLERRGLYRSRAVPSPRPVIVPN
jgi:hypothetical protein